MRGGCRYIDMKGVDLSSGATIPGIYDKIESTYPDKEIVLVNVNMTGSYCQTITEPYTISEGSFVFAVGLDTITITSDDVVTIS